MILPWIFWEKNYFNDYPFYNVSVKNFMEK